MEDALTKSAERQEERYTRIHQRFDEVANEMRGRLPSWATLLIGLLSAICAGLSVAAVK